MPEMCGGISAQNECRKNHQTKHAQRTRGNQLCSYASIRELNKLNDLNFHKELDFSSFQNAEVVPHDINLRSGDTAVGFHSFVLKMISSVFCDLMEGNTTPHYQK